MSEVDKLPRWLKPTNRVMVAVLLVAVTLSVYKPRGMTRYGWRKQQEQRTRLAQRVSAASRQKSRAAGDENGGDANRPETSPGDAHRC